VKYAEVGEYEKAFKVLQATKDPFYKAFALADIGVLLAKSGRTLNDKSLKELNEIVASH
jgi:hypothetical protein